MLNDIITIFRNDAPVTQLVQEKNKSKWLTTDSGKKDGQKRDNGSTSAPTSAYQKQV
ncbi:MAG: hypothetical protein WD717_00810 [Nitrosarchaeum sp.]